MCSDYYTNYQNPYDTKSYYGNSSSSDKAAPSPYLEDGDKNDIYHDTSNTGNAYADMDGKGNTENILAIDNGMSTDWQTASTITNDDSSSYNYHPSAQCCWRYHTVATNQGDWYLPSAGELGYLVSRWKAINASIQTIIDFGVFPALVLPINDRWWSSTVHSSGSAVFLDFEHNYVHLSYYVKNYGYYVRAFLAV